MNNERISGSLGISHVPAVKNVLAGFQVIFLFGLAYYLNLPSLLFFVVAYFVAKYHYPDVFSKGPQGLNTSLGVANTIILLSSSYFMAKAMAYIRFDERDKCQRYLWLALSCGCLYPIVKTWGLYSNNLQGLSTNTNEFYTVYYDMTFNHFLHEVGLHVQFCG